MAEALVVRSEVRVPLTREQAFRLFTDGATQWWPLDSHSVYGEEAVEVTFEPRVGGRIIEATADGRTSEWGVITDWRPGSFLAMSWYPGLDQGRTTQVDIAFTDHPDGGTLVELVHTGWEARGSDAARYAENYNEGWIVVLGRYAERAAA